MVFTALSSPGGSGLVVDVELDGVAAGRRVVEVRIVTVVPGLDRKGMEITATAMIVTSSPMMS
jgi:hypothetical protein